MRTINWTLALVATACLAGASLAQASTSSAQDESRQKSRHEQKADASADRRDAKSARRELDAAAAILDQLSEQRLAGISRDRLSQMKIAFRDLYNEYDETGGKGANREGRGFAKGKSPKGSWQDDYANIERRLDELGVRSEARESDGWRRSGDDRATGTSGDDRAAAGTAALNQLSKFRVRLEAFYAAATRDGDRDSKRERR